MYLALHSPFAIFVESFEPDMYTNEENILYITDLDGTLLNSKGIVSATSAHILHHLIEEEGLNFTIATAPHSCYGNAIAGNYRAETSCRGNGRSCIVGRIGIGIFPHLAHSGECNIGIVRNI